jgi:hypothetical protein
MMTGPNRTECNAVQHRALQTEWFVQHGRAKLLNSSKVTGGVYPIPGHEGPEVE